MNRDEILNMPAGYEINKLVAINVMGWALVNNHGAAGGKFWIGHGGSFGDISEMYLPDFSGDMNVAWSVVDAMCKKHFRYEIGGNFMGLAHKYAAFDNEQWADKNPLYKAWADTMPLAICRAALLAVEAV